MQMVALGSTGAITPDVSFVSLLTSQKERMKKDRI